MLQEILDRVLVAVYLRGGPGGYPLRSLAPTSRASALLQVVRASIDGSGAPPSQADVISVLQSHYLWEETSALRLDGRWEWASEMVASGRVLTMLDPSYPGAWRLRLGPRSPVCLYRSGPRFHAASSITIAMVGSRLPSTAFSTLTQNAAQLAAQAGWQVVSGGAAGVDSISVEAYLRHASGPTGIKAAVRIIVPSAPAVAAASDGAGVECLSLCAPGTAFSASLAIERNTLIYAMADLGLVFAPRYRVGGTWHGAREALRRHLCPLQLPLPAVGADPETCRAIRELRALGAQEWRWPDDQSMGFEAFRQRVQSAIQVRPGSLGLTLAS